MLFFLLKITINGAKIKANKSWVLAEISPANFLLDVASLNLIPATGYNK